MSDSERNNEEDATSILDSLKTDLLRTGEDAILLPECYHVKMLIKIFPSLLNNTTATVSIVHYTADQHYFLARKQQ